MAGGVNDGWINRAGLLALVGVSGARNVEQWEADGLPFVERTGRRGGKKAHWYETKSALRWLVDNASVRVSHEAKAVLRSMEGGESRAGEDATGTDRAPETGAAPSGLPSGPMPAAADGERTPGLDGAIERLQAGELAFADMMNKSLADGNIPRAVACGKQVAAFAETLAKLETHIRERDVAAGKLVDADASLQTHLKILSAVKNNLLAVPSSAVPHLLPLLRNPDDAYKAQEIVDRFIKDALRGVAETPPEKFC